MSRAWLSAAMLLAGTSLLVSAGHASRGTPTKLRQGGTLRVNLPVTDIDDIDPSIAFGSVSWQIEYSTALKLLNYPDAPAPRGSRLVLEGASTFAVSPDGRAYTFTIRRGQRFSNGILVKPKNYAYAIARAVSQDLQSPAYQFIADPKGTEILGARDVREKRAGSVRGVRIRGDKLIIRLARPDPTLLSKLSMPFFQAMPTRLSKIEKISFVDEAHPLPSAGPYYVSYRKRNRLVKLERNPFYMGRRPHRLSQMHINVATSLVGSYEDVRANRADYTLDLPRSAPEELGREFGLNGRFRVRPSSCISYIALNTSNPLFRNNPRLRRAVNYAIDRQAMVGLYGAHSRLPTDQYLPQGSPAFKNIDGYPFTPNLSKARRLAAGHVPSGGPWVYYHGLAAPGPERMRLVRASLRQIGIEIEPQGYRAEPWDPPGRRNSPHAFAEAGWCQDYPDPYNFINTLLYGGTFQEENNTNFSYFNSAAYNRRMEHAARLTGAARLRAYERLEHDLVTKAAPWAAWSQPANQFFFSESVDMRSFVYQPIYESPPYNLLALK